MNKTDFIEFMLASDVLRFGEMCIRDRYKDIHAINSSNLITDIALLGYCDRMGRKGADKQEEQKNIEMFYKKCKEKEGK